ncbi:DUF2303 family protein [Vibrio harveyi]|uniref:DUF2303 family protein n=1 Tax=Vibrio harveyi TaxID=669 RepID=UPI0025AF207B|nr:DUF2303 family protein [Vibrio harveyi]WJT09238.1 DUF2303 family protein [Vibrio harveyi]
MLEKATLDELIAKGNAPLFLDQLKDAKTQSQLIALPLDYKVSDLECYQEHRNSLRGKFSTEMITEFVEYGKVFSGEGSAVFINTGAMSAKAIFDIGTEDKPLHMKHTARVSLKTMAAYRSLREIDGDHKNQRQIAEWLEDYKDYLSAYGDTGEEIPMTKAIEAIRVLKFERKQGSSSEVQQFAASQSEYESIATKTKDELTIPAGFVFKCVPFLGLNERSFDMRLSIIRNETLTLKVKRFEEIIEEMALEFRDKLQVAQKDAGIESPVYVGSFE